MKLKKITFGNPLVNFHLWDDLEKYEAVKTDEELVSLYNELLNKYEFRPLVCSAIYAMITFSTGKSFNPSILL